MVSVVGATMRSAPLWRAASAPPSESVASPAARQPTLSVPDPKCTTKPPTVASRLAALLLPHIFPICSVVAACDPGATAGSLAADFRSGTLASLGQTSSLATPL